MTSLRILKLQQESKFLTLSNHVVQEMLQPAILMQTKAKKELGWEAEYDIKDMCADSWNFQQKNPNGYED